MRRLPLTKIIAAALVVASKPSGYDYRAEAQAATAPRGRPERGKSTTFYRELADSYRSFAERGKSPVKEIARRKRVSENTVHQWVYRARNLGFLEPSARTRHSRG